MMTAVEEGFSLAGILLEDQELGVLVRFLDLLTGEALRLGLSGIAGERAIVAKHLVDCAVLAGWLKGRDPEGKTLLDVGSGAGLPGIVVRTLVHGLERVDFLDAKKRASEWISGVCGDLGLCRTSFTWGRAEECGRGEGRETYDYVVCRAFGSLPVSLESCMPFVRVNGLFIAMRGAQVADPDELRISEMLGGRFAEVHHYELPWDSGHRHLVAFCKTEMCPESYPRNGSRIRKRPIVFHVKHIHHT